MKNKAIGSSFNIFLQKEGICIAVENAAIKKALAFQLLINHGGAAVNIIGARRERPCTHHRKNYRLSVCAAPKLALSGVEGKGGKLDHQAALTGDDLKDFVDQKLFPYFKKFKADAESPDTIE